jgi:hypothetical protein
MNYKDGTLKERNRFYRVFSNIKIRCRNKKFVHYKYYGGRGIKCLWKSFNEFKSDMFNSYVDSFIKLGNKIQIDRIDNDGDYCKENCRWVTAKENSLNKRNNISEEERIKKNKGHFESKYYNMRITSGHYFK